ncbi:anti-sigma regulatory factor [Candidatus Gracilibacteria bacterium]|nr:anti-sigma regulatory factor [Candidatus Gracilibacteria bacterium]NJM87512.1 anti-sigma regulatory factor [Hydrococcus sp. RU_2_2]NJP18125.1 anti-sigma regulatory factor [Hydrococcus sp. CRU_1_1]NJQ97073.1 anti-sigma regulatory factor [Hydrococcus sp. CSU_1_8]
MIAISLPATRGSWSKMSFTSTLYLCPVLDLLLAKVPSQLEPEIRLGLQEALVNAAKHGNKLDPSKTIVVQFSVDKEGYSWIISDEGCGFTPNCDPHWQSPSSGRSADLGDSLPSGLGNCDRDCDCDRYPSHLLPPDFDENGRGLCLLHQIFDLVQWNREGTELKLCKSIKKGKLKPLLC